MHPNDTNTGWVNTQAIVCGRVDVYVHGTAAGPSLAYLLVELPVDHLGGLLLHPPGLGGRVQVCARHADRLDQQSSSACGVSNALDHHPILLGRGRSSESGYKLASL